MSWRANVSSGAGPSRRRMQVAYQALEAQQVASIELALELVCDGQPEVWKRKAVEPPLS